MNKSTRIKFQYDKENRLFRVSGINEYRIGKDISLIIEMLGRMLLKNCKLAIFDLRNARLILPASEVYERPKKYRAMGFTSSYRVAFLVSKKTPEMSYYEDVVFNSGLNGKIFLDEQEAEEWVLGTSNQGTRADS